jgi:hypothetical protein
MSKRHQSSRRRSYGRRQHEVRERTDRRSDGSDLEVVQEATEQDRDGFSFFDLMPQRLAFAVGD